jgi:hypothetical protein
MKHVWTSDDIILGIVVGVGFLFMFIVSVIEMVKVIRDRNK